MSAAASSMSTHPLLCAEVGRRELLMGNEAVVRGAIEAGVGLVSGYPGTPASEIGDTFHLLHRTLGISFEYSVNEKVALELAFGASLAGARSLVSMKHLGLNYGADPLSTMPYIGVVGGMVIVSAADPSCLTSPNEQDHRHLARMLGLPTLDPSTPEEALGMTRFAFELSEACELPVLLRITTRVCHTRAPVALGPLPGARPRPAFRRDPARFLPLPANARRLREELQRRLERACARMAASPFNVVSAPSPDGPRPRRGLVAAGAPRNAVRDAVARMGRPVPVLELGTVHPLPEELIVRFLSELDEVLVVEELTPFLEDSLLAIAHHYTVPARIHGKRGGRMPWPFELEPEEVEARIRDFLGVARPAVAPPRPSELQAPPRPPVLCAGCPHRNTFHSVTAVFGERAVYVNDIGCYTLGASAPHHAGDVLLAMGSSIPIAAGIARATGERVVAFIGDSTFFHSGMPPLLDAVQNGDNVVVVVMDNDATAMTGLQPSPTTPAGPGRTKRHIADVVRAIGVQDVQVVPVADVEATLRAFQRAKAAKHLSVVIAEGPCALLQARAAEAAPPPKPQVDPSRCHTCGMAQAGLHCGLQPTVSVQRRVATQRAVHGGRAQAVPETSPCSIECPVGICIPAYVGAIAAGEPERALAAVTLRAALPSVCSHICHRPCEDSCVRAERDRPVAVNALKRYLTERHLRPAPAPRPPPDGLPVAVVGAGPAGLAAARELARRGHAPTLFEARERAGGMLEYAIPDYRMPREILRRDVEAVLAEGVRFEGGVRLGRDFSIEDLRRRGFGAIVLALGAQRGHRPELPGAVLPEAVDAITFLADPPSLQGERVVVIGGGDVAVDAGRTALRRGAARACLVFPEAADEMAAAADAVELARAEGVELKPGLAAAAIRSGPDGHVAGVQLGRVIGFSRGSDGAVSWERLEETEVLPATRVIFATGQRAVLEGIDLPAGLRTPSGWLAADAYGRTALPDVFVAGDVATGPSNVTAAMASGVRVGWAVDVFLSGGRPVPGPAAPPPRQGHRPARGRPRASQPSAEGPVLTEAEAAAEAERCLLCGMCQNCNACTELLGCPAIARDRESGHPRIEASACTACGACVEVCPNAAIGAPA